MAYLSLATKTGRSGEGEYKLASEMWIQQSVSLLGSVPVCADSTDSLLIMLSMWVHTQLPVWVILHVHIHTAHVLAPTPRLCRRSV